jgi:putative transcriptional regulator
MKSNLRRERLARGISQAELAELAEVSRQTINSIEVGRYSASLELAFRLAKIFNLKIEELFYE